MNMFANKLDIPLIVPYLEKFFTLGLTFILLKTSSDKDWGLYSSYLLLCGYIFHLVSFGSNDYFVDIDGVRWSEILIIKILSFFVINIFIASYLAFSFPIFLYSMYVVLDIEGLLIKRNLGSIVHRYRLARAVLFLIVAMYFVNNGLSFRPIYHAIIYCVCVLILIGSIVIKEEKFILDVPKLNFSVLPTIIHMAFISILTVFTMNGELFITSLLLDAESYGEIDRLLRGTIMASSLGILFWPIIHQTDQSDRINASLIYISSFLLVCYFFLVVPVFTKDVVFVLCLGVITVAFSSKFLLLAKRRRFFATMNFIYASIIAVIFEILILLNFHDVLIISVVVLVKFVFMYRVMMFTKSY